MTRTKINHKPRPFAIWQRGIKTISMKPGDKVICVDASIDPEKAHEIQLDLPNWITKGEEYTIRAILPNDGIVTGVLLEEVHNAERYFRLLGRYQEPAFATWRFRKLQYATASAASVEVAERIVA